VTVFTSDPATLDKLKTNSILVVLSEVVFLLTKSARKSAWTESRPMLLHHVSMTHQVAAAVIFATKLQLHRNDDGRSRYNFRQRSKFFHY